MLTFTQRRDMPGYQCFRGNIKRNGDEAFIAEIGESCIRGEDASINEMKITNENNDSFSVGDNNSITAGNESRIIDEDEEVVKVKIYINN